MEVGLNGGLAKHFSKHDKNLVKRLLKECDPNDILASFRGASFGQSTKKEELILGTIHKSFLKESERKDATLTDMVRLIANVLSERSVDLSTAPTGDLTNAPSGDLTSTAPSGDLNKSPSEPVQKHDQAEMELPLKTEIEEPVATKDYEIVTLSPEQIEGCHITRLVTADGEDIGAYHGGNWQAQTAYNQQVALPVQQSIQTPAGSLDIQVSVNTIKWINRILLIRLIKLILAHKIDYVGATN